MWYRASNRNCGFISQIAKKESRTRFYTALVKDLTMVHAPSTSDATSLPEDGEDTHDNSEDHYWMSKKPACSRDLRQWLSENEADCALTVSLNPLVCHPGTDRSLPIALSNSPSRSSTRAYQRDPIQWRQTLLHSSRPRQHHHSSKPIVRT